MRKLFSKQSSSFPVLVLFLALMLVFNAAPSSANALDDLGQMIQNSPLHTLRVQALKNYGLMINPYFKAGFDLTNNVFGAPEKRHMATIWTFTPGINITHTGGYGQMGLSYEAPFRYFTKFGMQNEQDQNFSAFVDLHPTEDLRVQVTEDMAQVGATAGAPGIEPLNYLDNTVTTTVTYDMDAYTAEAGYENFMREYAGVLSDGFSYSDNNLHVKGYYHLSDEKTVVFGGYQLGFIHYDENSTRNAVYHEFPVGFRTVLPMDIFLSATVAVHIRNQEAENRNDWWAFIGDVRLQKELTKRTSIETGFMRRPVEATFATTEIYDEKTIFANLLHKFSSRFRGRADISWANRDFESRATVGAVTVKRTDHVVNMGVGLDYALRKWLVLNMDYRYSRKNSNLSDFDATENRFSLGMTMPV